MRNRFYGARGRNCAGMESRAMECETVVVTALSPLSLSFSPPLSIFVYSVYIRGNFSTKEESDFHFHAIGLVKFLKNQEPRDRSRGNLVGWVSATNLLSTRDDRTIRSNVSLLFLVCVHLVYGTVQEAVKYTNIARYSQIARIAAVLEDLLENRRIFNSG